MGFYAKLKGQMDEFFAQQKERIAAARPWFDKLMTALTDIGSQVATAGGSKPTDLSALKPFEGNPFMQIFTPEQLAHWAYVSTLYQNKRLSTWQACLRPRDKFWDIPVPKIDSAFDNLFVPQPSWSPSTTQQLRKLVAAPYLAPNDWTPRSEAYLVFPLTQGTPG